MRTWLQEWTPVQLLWLIGAANLLGASGFGIPDIASWHHRHGQHLPQAVILPSLGMLLLGIIGSMLAESKLKDGIESKRWSDALLDSPKRFVTHAAYSIFLGALCVCIILYVVFSRGTHFSGSWMFLYPMMTLSRVRHYFSPRATSNINRPTIYPVQPLQSEHWGTPPRPFSN